MVATQEDLLSLSSSFSKIIKRGFGKGPESCYTVLKGNRLYVQIRNFMTPAEEILSEKQEYNLVTKFRSSVITVFSKELVQEASQLLGISFESFYQDWNFNTNSGILLLVNNRSNPVVKIDDRLEKKLYHLIRMVGSQLHKVPSQLKVVKYTQNICAIELKGVMLPLDHLLAENGDSDLFLTYTREIKKGYYRQKLLFEDLFNRSIEDLFMIWDIPANKGFLIFSFNKIYT
ncbi:DUF2294 domain-containing protein [Neobacillus drentensis]|uniref:Na-translocating system protein MpsC family protein n=1 Tax=Neobacillus drentensis TaxID=220684 RepID=UPI001F3DB39B|nr:Na-translocating system protein MpsC family protein [Neobacillus drentensis]ULT57905.1 DUF2294 domain-containing protein [Neobacillus drentensis]